MKGSVFPAWNVNNRVTVAPGEWEKIEQTVGGAGVPYPSEMIEAAQKQLNEFIHILEAEGVKVRTVNDVRYDAPYATPDWSISSGFCSANPRDSFLVVGNEIIETPMADRSRYFETWAYRELFKEYFKAGAKWTTAPKPQLLDDLYDWNYTRPEPDEPPRFVVTEFEPVFDAADFVRCGRDIFGQKSNATNSLGILWLQRHLGNDYQVHELHSLTPEAIHIDSTFMPLAPGKVLINPEYFDRDKMPAILKSWDILVAPPPVPHRCPLGIVSKWGAINVLMLDEERIIVEERQEPLIKALKEWGFKPIPCAFEARYPFMGSFHCSTVDIRRTGTLKSYF